MRQGLTRSIALALALFGASGCDLAPSKEWISTHRLVAEADNRVMASVCFEAKRAALASEDPLRAAFQFLERGKSLEGWRTELTGPYSPTPASLAGPVDSLVGAITRIASSFTPAVADIPFFERECYGEFALNCNKLIRARNILDRIDDFTLRAASEDYFRHRAALAKKFADADWRLTNLRTCSEGT